MKERNFVDQYLDHLYAHAERKFNIDKVLNGDMAIEKWREALKEALLVTFGDWAAPVALDQRIIEKVDRGDHTRVKLTYKSEEALDTVTYLLIPKGITDPRPGVVVCTGHGYGVRDTIGLKQDFSERGDSDPGYHKDFGLALMRKGYVVIAPEPLGFGEMRLGYDVQRNRGNSCEKISDNLLLLGRTMMGARVQQYVAATTLLAEMPEVDATRIGAMGISGGGLTSAFLAMIDERIKVLVSSGYPCMYKDSIYGVDHCVDNFPFGLLKYAENDDLMALVAPRAQLWESGSRDEIFPVAGVEEAARSVARMYQFLGVPERFDVDYFEGDHEISGRKAYDFLEKYL